MGQKKLTALVITYNEIGYIENCIESVSFANEIIVVDSYSTDGTYEFLKNYPKVKVLQKEFVNFTNQKAYALTKATNDWILFLDADELVTNPLQEEITKTINKTDSCSAYWFCRKFMFKNMPLHFCAWRTDKNYRLFRKSKVKFVEDKIVHETLDIKGESGILKEKLIHYSYKNYTSYKSKMLSYGRLKAKEAFVKEKGFSYLQLLFKPAYKFLYHYLIRLGFLDGKKGIIISYLSALGEVERYTELRKLYQTEEKSVIDYTPIQNYN